MFLPSPSLFCCPPRQWTSRWICWVRPKKEPLRERGRRCGQWSCISINQLSRGSLGVDILLQDWLFLRKGRRFYPHFKLNWGFDGLGIGIEVTIDIHLSEAESRAEANAIEWFRILKYVPSLQNSRRKPVPPPRVAWRPKAQNAVAPTTMLTWMKPKLAKFWPIFALPSWNKPLLKLI